MERHGSHSHTGPYARKTERKSILSKMKDSFKDMIYPSWLSGSSKNEDSGRQTSTAAELRQAPTSTAAPIVGPGNPNLPPFHGQGVEIPNGQPRTQEFAVPEASNVDSPFQSPNLPPPISEFTSSLLPLNRLTEKSDSVLANEDTMSQRSDTSKSTSGCSSMVPQQETGRQDSASGVEKRKAVDQDSYGSQQSPRSQDQQPSAKRPRLNVSLSSGNKTWTQRFNDTIQNQQPPGNLNRPAFNTSLFGSPFSEDTSVLGTSFHESSFYPGKTVYGGRSSFRSTQRRKVDLNQSLPSKLSFPVKSFIKAKPRTNPVKEAVTSSTAKRILDVLDRMPTPLSDAKKIPVILSHNWTQNPSFFSKDVASTSVGPPTRRHTMGGLASISANRQTGAGPGQHEQENKTMMDKTSASIFTAVGLQKGDTVRLASDQQPSTSSGKIRREKSYHKGSSSVKPSVAEEDTVIVAPELRTDFTLPVSQIPQFSFNTPSIPKSSSQKSTTVNHQTALNFTFSSPIAERIPGNKPASPQNIGGFQFSSPISLEKKDEAHGTASSKKDPISSFSTSISTTGSVQMAFSTAPKPKPSFNGPTFDAPSGGLEPATELKKGSVMDILGGGSSKLTDTVTSSKAKSTVPLQNGEAESQLPKADLSNKGASNVPLSALFKQTGWSCDICLIQNKEELDKCAACQAPRPGPKKQTGTTDIAQNNVETSNKATGNIPLSALFKRSGWSCDVCLIDNKEDIDKCVACQSPRPGPKKDTGQQDKSNLLSKSSLLPGNWVCSTCLIQNKAEDNICGACKASKTGTSKQAPPKDDFMAKFIPSSGQWECEVCLVQNKPDANTCVACQSKKPSKGFKQPTIDWVCDTCLVNNKAKDVKCVACNYSRPGPPKTQTVPSCVKSFTMSQPTGFSFSSAATSDSSKDTGTAKLSSTGGFKFGTTTSSSNGGFKFGASANSETTSNGSESTFKLSDSSKTVSGSGFKFGIVKPSDSGSDKSLNDTNSSGIHFGSVNSSEDKLQKSAETVEEKGNDQKNIWTPGIGGFQFGRKSSSDSSDKPGSGFKFGSNTGVDSSSTIKPSGDLQFGVKNISSAVGFQFGKTSSSSLVTSSNTPVTSISTLSNSTTFSSRAVVSSSDTLKMNTSVPSGFKLTTTGSFSSVTPVNKTLSEASSKNETGLTFTSNSSKDTNSIAVTTNSFTGFVFGAPTVSESKSEAQKPVFGGFANKSTASTTPAPAFGGFNFAQKKDEVQSFDSTITGKSDSMATKRGRDEDSGETVTKKGNFVFGSNTSSSTPFQFGAANSGGQINSSPFGVGQTSSVTTQAGGFTFNMNKPSDTAKPLFRTPVSSTQTTAVPVFGNTGSVFSFAGQKSEAQNKPVTTNVSLFSNFGNESVKSVTPSTGPAFNFGGANMNSTIFGSGTVNVFGGNATSTTPAFESAPSVYGAKDSVPVTTAAPVFGGAGVFQFGSDKTAGSNQPPQTNSVFAFGAKPAENTQSPASNTGFNFNSAQAGLGGTANFNFSQSAAPGAFAFSAAPAPSTGERKIKKAVRKLRR